MKDLPMCFFERSFELVGQSCTDGLRVNLVSGPRSKLKEVSFPDSANSNSKWAFPCKIHFTRLKLYICQCIIFYKVSAGFWFFGVLTRFDCVFDALENLSSALRHPKKSKYNLVNSLLHPVFLVFHPKREKIKNHPMCVSVCACVFPSSFLLHYLLFLLLL